MTGDKLPVWEVNGTVRERAPRLLPHPHPPDSGHGGGRRRQGSLGTSTSSTSALLARRIMGMVPGAWVTR